MTTRSDGKSLLKTGLLALIVFTAASCGGQRDFRSTTFSAASPYVEPVTYTQINNQIIKPKCISCHTGSGEMSFETYDSVRRHVKGTDYKNSELYEQVDSGTMPPVSPSLSDDDVLAIRKWIESGANP